MLRQLSVPILRVLAAMGAPSRSCGENLLLHGGGLPAMSSGTSASRYPHGHHISRRDAAGRAVRAGRDSLVIYSFMFPRDPADDRPGPAQGRTAFLPILESPCPSCTAMLDQLDGAAEHVSQRVNLVAVAKSPLPRLLAYAEERGWRRLRLLSSIGNTYNRDYLGETEEGDQFDLTPEGRPVNWDEQVSYS